MSGIEELRRRIDEIDIALTRLLNERAHVAQQIGRHKVGDRLPVYDPVREEEIIRNVIAANKGPLPEQAIKRLFERIMDEIRSVERLAMQDDTKGSER
ncbi:MAG: hypothetical protein A2X67_11850 [Ignavibacteria bacterium GWA2_55_11]|nr:MAG: hypothetical protein A2X67_11850 [Ignavibacteria bacterium GWA2_55_11]OGU46808.1 MAG: hypothetical protein A2X68_02985 [Ignavibacteria bacterium GWC2_56_12]OGU62562.1 MAG: hypothetical protein A3C56_08745 [Ignavibacteria bacterium RIFCSPHIGHO2_02_FULL_56_12]OGU69784.1 MAG: hypothetical protein A3H45_12070 [Ignavibacteria bacterium RIFCSPLOWO2_02_FULL_55_14]OGU73239.1 MAG: hypothetical protein A3G43_02400 [Ignavibacteria bacterium RIFCSPLOWO2_12_FULL_56_21]HAV23043.1 chorismate mutase [